MGPELVEWIGLMATLDLFMDRDPHAKPMADDEMAHFLDTQRRIRASIEMKGRKREAKKQGVIEQEDSDDDAEE